MSSKSKGTKGAFGGIRGRIKKAQKRWLANRQLQMTDDQKDIMNAPTFHVTERIKDDSRK